MDKKKETFLNFEDFVEALEETSEDFEIEVKECKEKPKIYKKSQMVIVPEDDEEWVDPDYDHKH